METTVTEGLLGVVVVTFNSEDVIENMLNSLSKSYSFLRVVIVDNRSSDETTFKVESWAASLSNDDCTFKSINENDIEKTTAQASPPCITLLKSAVNGGYASGVNKGICYLSQFSKVEAFWIINPDVVVPEHTPTAFFRRVKIGEFGLLSGRVVYADGSGIIQTDGGIVDRLTGVCSSVNAGKASSVTPLPSSIDLDFLTGANLVASREYVETVGMMPEHYFLYYEEVDWAFRRGNLSLELVPGAEVHHIGGTSIGSATRERRASAFSNYFNHRNRIWFARTFFPRSRWSAQIWSLVKALQAFLQGDKHGAYAILAGALDLGPPRAVISRLSPDARSHAFLSRSSQPPKTRPR